MSSAEPSKTKGYKFSSKIDLDALILSAINNLCDPKTNKEAREFDAELEKLQPQVKTVESKWFEQCTAAPKTILAQFIATCI